MERELYSGHTENTILSILQDLVNSINSVDKKSPYREYGPLKEITIGKTSYREFLPGKMTCYRVHNPYRRHSPYRSFL
jgi:hypothetical protein